MSINKIEIQDGSGNVYYPKTSIDSVIYSDSTSIEEKIRILEYRLNELKSQLANSINNKTGSSLTSNSTVDEMTVAINSIKTLEQATADANATAGNILVDKTAYVNGAKITGTMPNKGTITASLNCGGSYTIPAGYHNGSGKVTANSLASQISATVDASKILQGYSAWVNGSKINGTATIESLGGSIPYSNTITVTYTSGESTAKTINIGFRPKFVIVKPKTDVRCYMRSEAFSQFNRGWTDYDSSTGTENDYKTKITGFTSNGFIYNNFYNPDKVGTVSRTETLTFAVIAM